MRNRIKEERAKHRITQEDLAHAIGSTKQTINKIENNKSDPKVGLAFRIARFFGINIHELFEEE